MIFTHGTKQDLNDNEKFKVFNYKKSQDGTSDVHFINNGNDQEGVGIYAWIGRSEDAINSAERYTSDDSAFAYILDVDVDSSDLMNKRANDELSVDELSIAVELFILKKRNLLGFNKDTFDSVINDFEFNFENSNLTDINELLLKNSLKIILDEYYCPTKFKSFYQWQESLEEYYSVTEPCSNITDEGGPEAVASYAINSSDNLWETIESLGNSISVEITGKGIESYNETFQESILESFPDHNLTASIVNNGDFAVIFDTNKINIIEKINLKERTEITQFLDSHLKKQNMKQEKRKKIFLK